MRADTAAFLRTGGDSGPSLVAGKANESLLIKTILGTHDDIAQMPYKKPPLAEAKIEVLRAWINEGAVAPPTKSPEKYSLGLRRPGACRCSGRDPPGLVTKPHRRLHFRAARKRKNADRPFPEADRVTLLRRVSLDLIGLPPTPAEVAAFLADYPATTSATSSAATSTRREAAFGRVVTRLLASPHHGERWARPWLDVARYADSNGYSIDAPARFGNTATGSSPPSTAICPTTSS